MFFKCRGSWQLLLVWIRYGRHFSCCCGITLACDYFVSSVCCYVGDICCYCTSESQTKNLCKIEQSRHRSLFNFLVRRTHVKLGVKIASENKSAGSSATTHYQRFEPGSKGLPGWVNLGDHRSEFRVRKSGDHYLIFVYSSVCRYNSESADSTVRRNS